MAPVFTGQRTLTQDIQSAMPHFLLQRADPSDNFPAGFVLLEDFACPNCRQIVHIASTANSPECMKQISTARNIVALQCPDHEVPVAVRVGEEGRSFVRW
jgi:hypothetical protein